MRLWSDRPRAIYLRARAQTLALGPQRGLGAVGDVQLPKDPRQVRLDRLLGDRQPPRNQFIRQALGEQLQHVPLAVARALDRLGPVARDADELDVLERLDQPAQAVADDAVVVGQHHANQAGTSSSTVVPSPGVERTASVPLDCRTRSSSNVNPRWPPSPRRARCSSLKPLPSSTTVSRVVSRDGRETATDTDRASAYLRALATASRATR